MIKEYERELNELQEGKLISKEDLHEGDEIIYNGEHYFVTLTDTGTDFVWITDDESERYNRNAQGWTVKAGWIDEVIGQPEEDELDESLKEDYEKKHNKFKIMNESSASRYADTDAQEESIKAIENTLNSLGIKVHYGTKIGKYPQTVILDIKYQDNAIYIISNGKVLINGDYEGEVNPKDKEAVKQMLIEYEFIDTVINESWKNFVFIVKCNDGPKELIKVVAEDKAKAEEYAKKMYAQNHTTYADDRYNIWSIEAKNESLNGNNAKKIPEFETDNLTESKEDTQYGVHSFSQSSIIFRGTEEECAEFIADHNLWDDAEIYAMTPDDPHYLKEAEEDDRYTATGRKKLVSDETMSLAVEAARTIDPNAKRDYDDDFIYGDDGHGGSTWVILLNGDGKAYSTWGRNAVLTSKVEKAVNDAADAYWADFDKRWEENNRHLVGKKMKESALNETYYAVIEVDGKERRFPFNNRDTARDYIAKAQRGELPEFKGKKIGSTYTEALNVVREEVKPNIESKDRSVNESLDFTNAADVRHRLDNYSGQYLTVTFRGSYDWKYISDLLEEYNGGDEEEADLALDKLEAIYGSEYKLLKALEVDEIREFTAMDRDALVTIKVDKDDLYHNYADLINNPSIKKDTVKILELELNESLNLQVDRLNQKIIKEDINMTRKEMIDWIEDHWNDTLEHGKWLDNYLAELGFDTKDDSDAEEGFYANITTSDLRKIVDELKPNTKSAVKDQIADIREALETLGRVSDVSFDYTGAEEATFDVNLKDGDTFRIQIYKM